MSWLRRVRRHPSAFLLAVQLLSLLLYPQMVDSESGRVIFGAFGVVVALLAMMVVDRSPAATWVAWLLGVPVIAVTSAAVVFHHPGWLVWSAALASALYAYAAGSLIAYMMKDHRVTSDELFAAGATFTLIAWSFAYAYTVCQAWDPDSFAGSVEPERARDWMELLYLSFTTLSGVGVGDILPLGPQARSLVMLEQFAGIGYIAIVVSRLIGLTIISIDRKRGQP